MFGTASRASVLKQTTSIKSNQNCLSTRAIGIFAHFAVKQKDSYKALYALRNVESTSITQNVKINALLKTDQLDEALEEVEKGVGNFNLILKQFRDAKNQDNLSMHELVKTVKSLNRKSFSSILSKVFSFLYTKAALPD